MAYLLLACPKCHTPYKVPREHADAEAVCRACGHRFVPGQSLPRPQEPAVPAPPAAAPQAPAAVAPVAAPTAAPAAPPAPKPQAKAPGPLSALEAMAQAAAATRGSGPGAKPRPQGSKPQVQAKAPAPKAAPSSPPKPAAPLSALDALAAAARAAKGEPELPEAEPVDEEPVAQVEPEPEKPAAAAPAPAPEPAPAKAPEAAPEEPVVVVPEKPPEPAPASRRGPDPTATPFRTTGHVAREEKADALVGTRINGFKIQSRIGTGGFGVVYRAFDTNLERSVAIKMLPPRIAKAGQGILDRFLREARSAAKLAHPNIVTIHQICPYKDTYYIVMELVDGGALHEYLAAQKRFAPAEAMRIIRAAAEGLGHAHRRGIIHRDVKPGNIMMTNDGQVKVSDFGLARDVLQGHDIVGAGHSLGTPRYMAPEQARGEEPTGSSDLYSLAATFYALLTGRAPFDAPNEREIMIKQVQEPVPDPRQFVPDLPIAAFRFFEKAMAKDPNDRYMTADDFVAALDRLDFSQRDASAPMAQALASQIGAISAEDRGSHLTETLGRAVRMAQRQRTPPPGRVVETLAAPTAKGKAGWKTGLLIGLIVVVVIAAAIVAAILMSQNRTTDGPPESPPPPAKAPTPGETPTPPAPTPGETPTTPAAKPGETPTTPAIKPGEKTTPPIVTSSSSPQESNAQAVLKEAQEYEKQPGTPPEDAIRVYEENVIKVYPKTKAAVEAQKAVDRLRGGKQDETPPAKTDAPPEKPAEKAPEKPPAE